MRTAALSSRASSRAKTVRPRCKADVMTATATVTDTQSGPGRTPVRAFGELSELTGQRNAIDGRIVDIIAEIDRDGLWGATGAVGHLLVAWKTATSHAMRQPSRPWPAGWSPSPLRPGHAGGPSVAGSGRGDRRPRRDGPMTTTHSWPRSPPSVNCAPRSGWSRDPIPAPGPTGNRRSARPVMTVRLLADHPAAQRVGDPRGRPAVPSRRADRRVATGPGRRAAPDTDGHRRVHAAGRDRMGWRGAAPLPGQRTTVVVHPTSTGRSAHCTSARCYRTPSGNT